MDMKKRLTELQETLSSELSKGFQTALHKVDLQRTPRIGTKLLFTAIGIGIGASVGITAALLFSPASGKQVRAKLMGAFSKATQHKKIAQGDARKEAAQDADGSARLNSHARRPAVAAPPLAAT